MSAGDITASRRSDSGTPIYPGCSPCACPSIESDLDLLLVGIVICPGSPLPDPNGTYTIPYTETVANRRFWSGIAVVSGVDLFLLVDCLNGILSVQVFYDPGDGAQVIFNDSDGLLGNALPNENNVSDCAVHAGGISGYAGTITITVHIP